MNGLYDWGWLRADLGVTMPPSDQLEEVGALAALVDENQLKYSLDAHLPAPRFARQGHRAAGGGVQGRRLQDQQEDPARSPTSGNCRRAMSAPTPRPMRCERSKLSEKLMPIIEREGTRDGLSARSRPDADGASRCAARGIRIDQDAAEQGRDEFLGKRDAALKELSDQHGAPVSMDEINGRKWKAKTFERYGIISPRKTPKGKPSFSAGNSGWMGGHEHWLPRLIALANKYHDRAATFIQGHILDHIVNGRIYGEIHRSKPEEGGTKSLRFSVSNPPLQQMPIARRGDRPADPQRVPAGRR